MRHRAFYLCKYSLPREILNNETYLYKENIELEGQADTEQYFDENGELKTRKSTKFTGKIENLMLQKYYSDLKEKEKEYLKKEEANKKETNDELVFVNDLFWFEMDARFTDLDRNILSHLLFTNEPKPINDLLVGFDFKTSRKFLITYCFSTSDEFFVQRANIFLDHLCFSEADERIYVKKKPLHRTVNFSKRVAMMEKFTEYVEILGETREDILGDKLLEDFGTDACLMFFSFTEKTKTNDIDVMDCLFLKDFQNRKDGEISIFKRRTFNKNWVCWFSDDDYYETKSFLEAFYILRKITQRQGVSTIDCQRKQINLAYFDKIFKQEEEQ